MSFEKIEKEIAGLEGPIGPLMYQHDNGIAITVDAAKTMRLMLDVVRAADADFCRGMDSKETEQALTALKEHCDD